MNLLDFYTKFYGRLGNYGMPVRVLSPIRWVIRTMANKQLPKYLCRPIKKNHPVEKDLIVSLTSFPARIDNVWIVVECMLRQTITPSKVILWLSKDEFPEKSVLPKSLAKRENKIFEIRLVDGNIRSHKKYFYASLEFNNKLLFLIDDDIYYPSDIIEKSLKLYKQSPHSVICNYGSQIRYDKNGTHLPYLQWQEMAATGNIFFGSGGGTLFCPKDMFHDLTNKSLALKLTPTADDIWLNTMAKLSGLKILKATNNIILSISNKYNSSLSAINNGQSQNDVQLAAVEDYYGRCFDKHYKSGEGDIESK